MDKFGIKATIYDLMGYFVPGFLTIIALYMYNNDFLDFEWILTLQTVNYSLAFYVILFISSYILGHIISSLTSFIFENEKIPWNPDEFCKKLPDIDKKSNEIFGLNYKEVDKRILSSYCQTNFPDIYNTAFIFKSIYGFSRNLLFSATIFII
jgi:hypothetical protein